MYTKFCSAGLIWAVVFLSACGGGAGGDAGLVPGNEQAVTVTPTPLVTNEPTSEPTIEPTLAPTLEVTIEPTLVPTAVPTLAPTANPTVVPTLIPTPTPTPTPTPIPTPETNEPRKLDADNWGLTSTQNSDDLGNAIDRNASTRWATKADQTPGQALVIDLGEASHFDRIVLDSANSPNDYPQGYSVYISDDGDSWVELTSGSDAEATTVIDFEQQYARYIKLEQTGSSDDYWWSIHELEIYMNATGSQYGEFVVPEGYTVIESIDELKTAFAQSDGKFIMRPGLYTVTELLEDQVTILRTTGSNNIYDFTNVTIDIPTQLISQMRGTVHTFAEWKMEGNNNTFLNGTFKNSYPDGSYTVTDYKAHNENYATGRSPGGSSTFVRVWGDGNQLINNTFEVRGSFPYGYGEIYGKGSQNTFGLRKHAGLQVVGDNTVIDGLSLTQLAFGHGIFMQGADNTIIRNSTVQGAMRLGADMYNDGEGSLPDQSEYKQYFPDWREGPIPTNKMFALTEDGIRAYASGTKLDGSSASTGSVTVENTSVTNLRSCFALVAAAEAYINNVEVRGCEDGFSLPRNGQVLNSRVDAAFGHVLYMPYGNEYGAVYDITLIEADYQIGDHYLAHIAGSSHDITIHSDGNTPTIPRIIKVGYAWDRWDVTGDLDRHGASNVNLINETAHPVELTVYSSGATGSSVGEVTNNGSGNSL